MADIKLFRIGSGNAKELPGTSVAVEKTLQALVERHLEALLGVRFLATEYSTGRAHGGRIDTLGIDENYAPVIIEYKRSVNENVINQGLFYLDWLLDHKAEFKLLVMERIGQDEANIVDWRFPRLLCIAADFTRYDEYAIQQIDRNIELIRYRRYEEDLLLLEQSSVSTAQPLEDTSSAINNGPVPATHTRTTRTVSDYLASSPAELQDLFETLKAFLVALGDEVQVTARLDYFAFRRIRNFATVEVHPNTRALLVYVKVNPSNVQLEQGFTRDVRNIGHFGTGDLEIRIRSEADLDRAKPLLLQSYQVS